MDAQQTPGVQEEADARADGDKKRKSSEELSAHHKSKIIYACHGLTSDTTETPSITQLMTQVRPLLAPNGQIAKPENIEPFYKLMKKVTEDSAASATHRIYFVNILSSSRNVHVIHAFTKSTGMDVLRVWILKALKDQANDANRTLIAKILDLLKRLPLDLETLAKSSMGKVIKRVQKEAEQENVRNTAHELEKSWMALLAPKAEPTPPPPQQQQPQVKQEPQPQSIQVKQEPVARESNIQQEAANLLKRHSRTPSQPPAAAAAAPLQPQMPVQLEKKGRPKKTVSFKPDDQLVHVRYFEAEEEDEHHVKHFATPHELDIAEAMQAFRKNKTLDPVLTWNEPRQMWMEYIIHKGYLSELKQSPPPSQEEEHDIAMALEEQQPVEIVEDDALDNVMDVHVPIIPWTLDDEDDDDDISQDLMHASNTSEQSAAYKARHAYESLMQLLAPYTPPQPYTG